MSRWRLEVSAGVKHIFPQGKLFSPQGKTLWHAPKLFSQPEKTFRRMENAFFRASLSFSDPKNVWACPNIFLSGRTIQY